MENFNIPLPNFSISEFITKKATNYSLQRLRDVPFHAKQDIEKLETELYNYRSVQDKIQFIGIIIKHIILVTKTHTDKCTRTGCRVEDESQELLYFLYNQLEDEGFNINNDTFTSDETYQNSNRINDIIYALEELKAGQEIIAEDIVIIERAREDFRDADSLQVFGKKKWFKFLGGIVLEYASNKVLDGIFKSQILPILGQLGLGKYLN